ncbi:MAG: endo-1,4-beta-xylanase [Armatimonadota bacterium]|nr:MAG: endo-1,4-beta-xylanase [Armatimonadota bacterium]
MQYDIPRLVLLFAAVMLLAPVPSSRAATASTAAEILAGASQRIEQHRKGDIAVVVLDRGQPVPGATVEVEQTGHEFLFGCNAYGLRDDDSALQQAYREQFAALFNYATLPFYWDGYEPQRGAPQTASRKAMARWCAEHGIRAKGHPLVWHHLPPAWVPRDATEAGGLLRDRVRSIVSEFKGLIDTWDVINESTVSARMDNPVGLWVKEVGPVRAAADALGWARGANQQATLIVNDFNVSQEYEEQIQGLIDAGRAPDAIGIQSHMHRGVWPLERVWEGCETYGRFGIPIHFTETTVLSGQLKRRGDGDEGRADWPTTPWGEQSQARYVEQLYRLLFSHPRVEAITWWDFSDLNAWQRAPAGFVRKDMSAKPAYRRLLNLVKGEWWTDVTGETDANGEIGCRGFYGTYRVTATAPDGRKVTQEVRWFKRDERRVTLRLPSQ